MEGWLIANGFLSSKKFQELYVMFQESAKKFSLDLRLIRNDQILVDTGIGRCTAKPDFVLFWDKDIKLASYLEKLGIRVFNPARSIEICDDKALTHLELMNQGIKMPRTIFAPMTYSNIGYSNFEFLNHIKSKLDFPIVIKEVFGSFGQQVYIAHDESELEAIVKDKSKSKLIFQEFIKSSMGKDVRLQVVGKKVVAAMYRYNDSGDFRANLSNGGKMKGYTPTKEQEKLAIKTCQVLGLDFAGVDILFGENDEPIVCEVNSNAHFKNITDVSRVNIADKIIKYIIEEISV